MNIVISKEMPECTDEDFLKFLTKRRGILDGVCITGGEPTLYEELPSFIRLIRDLGYRIKLDTNGTNPGMLRALMSEGLLDYVAMDIKSSFPLYSKACGIPDIRLSPIKESIDMLIGGNVEYEFRTTAVNELLDDQAIEDIALLIKGAKRYFLQGFVMSEHVPDRSLTPVPKEKLLQYMQELSSSIGHVELRGL